MAQVAFDLEIGVETIGYFFAVLQVAAKLTMERRFRKIGDMRGHTRDRQTLGRVLGIVQIGAALPVGVGHNRLATDFMKGDVLSGVARGSRNGDRGKDAMRIGSCPLQRLHAAHGTADDAEEIIDAEPVEQHCLRPHHVCDGDDRKRQAIGFAGGGVDVLRPSRAHAGAKNILADHEIAIRVDGEARSDHGEPPAGLARDGVGACRILVAGQGVADEDHIGLVGVERAVSLISDLEGCE